MRLGSSIILLCVFAGILAGWVCPVPAHAAAGDMGAVDAYIAETMRRLPIAGLALAIVRGDEILYLQGYGTANTAGDPVTPQTPFMMASVTKSLTALAVQQLAAEGKIDLDAPLQAYLPEFALADRGAAAAITLDHLLDHTSGISQIEGSQPYLHSTQTTLEQAMARLARYRPRHAPGEQYDYSNWNYVLLGEVVARASGQPYAGYVQSHILDPLEMSGATFDDHHTVSGLATGHLIVLGARVPYDEKYIPATLSAGYLTASAEDMAHYLIPVFNQGQYRGRSVLPAQGEGWYDGNWNWQPGRPNDVSYLYSGAHNSFNTALQFLVLHKVGVVVLMNTRLDTFIPGPTAGEIALNVARIVIGSPYQVPSNRVFYGGYALLDGFLLLAGASIVWQAARLPGWPARIRAASRPKRLAAWIGVGLDLMVSAGVLALPALVGTQWNILLYQRVESGVPLLAIGVGLGAVGLCKLAWNLFRTLKMESQVETDTSISR